MATRKKTKKSALPNLKPKRAKPGESAAIRGGRDAASGLPTGKRQHKPLTIT